MTKAEKNTLFNKVVNSNAEAFKNSVISQAEIHGLLKIANRDITEDQIREEAVKFFNAQLSKYLAERLENKLGL